MLLEKIQAKPNDIRMVVLELLHDSDRQAAIAKVFGPDMDSSRIELEVEHLLDILSNSMYDKD